jgi:hypothetical protein
MKRIDTQLTLAALEAARNVTAGLIRHSERNGYIRVLAICHLRNLRRHLAQPENAPYDSCPVRRGHSSKGEVIALWKTVSTEDTVFSSKEKG